MKHLKIYENNNDDEYNFDYDWGGHAFVLARYKGGWDKFKWSTSFKNDEFVPCMVSGWSTDKWFKRSFCIIGHAGSFNIDEFEILKDSDKGFKEMIEVYSASSKYNL